MNEEQENLATEIISFIKKNGNNVFKRNLLNEFSPPKRKIRRNDWDFIMSTIVNEYNLVKLKGDTFSLTKNGLEFNSFEELKLKDKLELEKLQTDLSLAKQTLKEFPKTKWFARIGFIIGVVLALKELYILIMQS